MEASYGYVMCLKQIARDKHRHSKILLATHWVLQVKKYLKFGSDGISFLGSNTKAAAVAPHCGEHQVQKATAYAPAVEHPESQQ